jgi:bacteriorhodopsin
MSSNEILLHWIYVAIMFISGIHFYIKSRNPKHIPKYKYVIHMMIVIWSGLAYSAMALDQGYTFSYGQKVVYARYIDWVVTTPLLLMSLSFTGMLLIDKKLWLKAGLIGAQVVMIITGLVAELSPENQQWYWYAMGCIALIIVLYMFWSPLYKLANTQGPELKEIYRKSATFLTVQWILYPVVWFIGSMGLGLLDTFVTTVGFIILPIISKAGFGYYNLGLLRNMKDKKELINKPA